MSKKNTDFIMDHLVEKAEAALNLEYVLALEGMSAEEKLGYLRGVQDALNIILHFSKE